MKKCLVLLSALVLSACSSSLSQGGQTPASSLTATSLSETPQTEMTTNNDKDLVGNDEIGYMSLSEQAIDFNDYNNNPDLANTQQWFDTSSGTILSLTSFDKTNYSKVLEIAADAWEGYQEVDVLLNESLQVFLALDGADVKADQDTFNNFFHDTALGWVDLTSDDGDMLFLVIAFQPEKDSDKLYLLSAEGTEPDAVRDFLMQGFYTWVEKN